MNCDPYFRITCTQRALEHREREFPHFKEARLIQITVETEMHHVHQCLRNEMHKLDVAYASGVPDLFKGRNR